jgi:hypothetical protein
MTTPSQDKQGEINYKHLVKELINIGVECEAGSALYRDYEGRALNFIHSLENRIRADEKRKTLDEVLGFLRSRLMEYKNNCLTDEFINGRFWEAKETQTFLSSLRPETKPLEDQL